MKTIEVTVTKAGEVTISDEELKPGMVLQLRDVTPLAWPPVADAEHPLWGEPIVSSIRCAPSPPKIGAASHSCSRHLQVDLLGPR